MVKEWAPIIIPTLNRYEHFERCISSLSENIGAEQTEIYISVDYPPANKYKEGYNKICNFLNTSKSLKKFKKFYIFFQKENLGAWGNTEFLKKMIADKGYKKYIYTEDDNEFSINFLQYINLGLDLFEKDTNIISINGMKDTDYNFFGENYGVGKMYPAYGVGSWVYKEDDLEDDLERILLKNDTWNLKSITKLFKKNKYIFALYVNGIICTDRGVFWNGSQLKSIDSARTIYMYITNKYCIIPSISKVRNWGNDGSGDNMPKSKKIENKYLDTNDKFEYNDISVRYNDLNDKIAEKYLKTVLGFKYLVKAIIQYSVFLILGKNRKKFLKIKG